MKNQKQIYLRPDSNLVSETPQTTLVVVVVVMSVISLSCLDLAKNKFLYNILDIFYFKFLSMIALCGKKSFVLMTYKGAIKGRCQNK